MRVLSGLLCAQRHVAPDGHATHALPVQVAVKVIDPAQFAHHVRAVHRLRREVSIGLELHHPNVVRTFGLTLVARRPAGGPEIDLKVATSPSSRRRLDGAWGSG